MAIPEIRRRTEKKVETRRKKTRNKKGRVAPMEALLDTASRSSRSWSPAPDASPLIKGIDAMLHPRNIVLVGATDKPGNYAERIWNNLVKYKIGRASCRE